TPGPAAGTKPRGRPQSLPEALLDFLPVHNAPPRADVIGSPVLILQIVGVLPHVETHHRDFPFHKRAVLVGRRGDFELSAAVQKPGPARTEAGGRRGVELFFELIETAECAADRLSKRARWLGGSGG